MGNSILVVEHDQETIESADYVIDLGPGAGKNGGMVTFSGVQKNCINRISLLRGKNLSGEKQIKIQKLEEKAREFSFFERSME
ncbi:hypothetical protein Ct9H90mP29_04740 [bacterium]|nr:MAG: hypothetical protein Ct9H90mP29_04740 [bacterium]